jgi:hypothetical protein
MPRQLVSSVGTNNANVKAKEFWSLSSALAVIHHDVLLYIRRFCR